MESVCLDDHEGNDRITLRRMLERYGVRMCDGWKCFGAMFSVGFLCETQSFAATVSFTLS
jgi:hypothetical protein